jgi:hypothetical protein
MDDGAPARWRLSEKGRFIAHLIGHFVEFPWFSIK